MKINYIKLGIMALMIMAGTAIQAQQTSGSVGKQAAATLGSSTGYVKVIDNKGTIKYLQSKNGITQFTDTAADGGVVTTWQLGGTLTEAVNITTGAQEFKLTLHDGTNQGTFVLDGVVQESGAAAGTITATTGWTLLTRDQATGQVKKLLVTDLVSGIYKTHTQSANAAANVAITVTGLPVLTAATTNAKLFVYRNGAKLRSGTDFVAIADTVTITYSATDLPMYKDDVVEIQYIK